LVDVLPGTGGIGTRTPASVADTHNSSAAAAIGPARNRVFMNAPHSTHER
jgi:hypothetical protein